MTIHVTWQGLLEYFGGLACGAIIFAVVGWLILMAGVTGWDNLLPTRYVRWRSDRRVRKYNERKARDGRNQDR